MWMMLQEEPDDYVVATGKSHSVKQFLERAENVVMDEGMACAHVILNKDFYRPAEVNHLEGDPTKIREKLGWEPEIDFDQLVREMTLEGRHAEGIHRLG
jgi:GDPmannose 4,6-dehydratase